MELRTRKAWAAALLAVTVMALASGRAVAQGMDPGELKRITDGSAGVEITDPGEVKALTESFTYEVPKVRVLEPGELKRIAEAPARFAVLVPGDDSTTVVDSEGVDWSGIGVASFILLLAVGAAVSFNRRRHNHIAPA
jgi:hypothetical protein